MEGSDQKLSYNPRNLSLCGNVGVEEEDLLSQEEAEEGFQAQRNSPGLLSSHIWRNSDQSQGSLLLTLIKDRLSILKLGFNILGK